MAEPLLNLQLHPEPFEPLAALAQWQGERAMAPPAAECSFIGRVRGTSGDGEPLQALELEHYPGMTESQLQRLAAACARRHPVAGVMVRHRTGLVLCGDAIVVVAVLADRRGPAQRCCQELLEALKHEAPFWKREWSSGVGEWVVGNTPLAEAG
jgi:molybdopterin synthase catalytic subunit